MDKTISSGLYHHFKGKDKRYHVFFVSTGTENGEKIVVYMPLYGEHKWEILHRTLSNFTEEVDRPEYNYKGPRFFPVTWPIPSSTAPDK